MKEGKWKERRNGHGCRGIVEEECKRKSNYPAS
jgi:frataxin-like iron-binding protein CyaY